MPEFSACYFCGTALDAPLSEYPVVPKALQPAADQQRTVVLCPTCRRKLGAVVDTVVQAIDDAPDTDSIQQELAESSGSDEPSLDESGELNVQRLDDDAPADDGGFEFQDQDGNDEGSTESAEEGAAAAGADGTNTDDSEVAEQDPLETGEQSRAASDPEADEQEGAGEGKEGTAEDDVDEEEPQMTALEYNKVMRLLQNREFPVDKAEFKVVATNAYQIDDDEFEAVIEAAEKRDLIAVENGQIVDAD